MKPLPSGLLHFKSEADRSQYGAHALIMGTSESSCDGPHCERITLVELATENDTKLQWPQRCVSARLEPTR